MESVSSPTTAWAYFVAKFSSELLLFELIGIFALIAIYAAYWVLKKRRMGSVDQHVPSNVVKTYLNELISQAYFVRKQLFGLLADAGMPMSDGSGPSLQATPSMSDAQSAALIAAAQKIAANPDLNSKMGGLESKLTEQSKAMDQLLQEKIKLENELASAIAAGAGKSTGGGGADPAELTGLKKKVKELEERLAEYSVIEDDLANLKRLQQENAKLKEMLGPNAPASTDPAPAATPAAVAAPATPAATPTPAAAASATSAQTTEAPKPAEVTAAAEPNATPAPAKADTAAKTEPAIGTTKATPAAAPGAPNEPQFDDLANQVQQSLKEPAAEKPAAKAEPAPKAAPAAKTEPAATKPAETKAAPAATPSEPSAAPTGTPLDNVGKSDEDLLSEFEKMLNM